MKIKAVSYNLFSGFGITKPYVRNYDNAIKVLSEIDADFIGLQEIGKHPRGNLPECSIKGPVISYLASGLGMYGYFAKAIDVYDNPNLPYGNGFLSKYPIISAKTVIIPDATRDEDDDRYETRSVLVADVDYKGGIRVIVTHFGLVKGERINAVKTVLEHVRDTDKPIIFMGDLNARPDSPDLLPLYEALSDTAENRAEPITYPSDYMTRPEGTPIPKGFLPRKIDYIFTSSDFSVKKVYTYDSLASDHLPLVAELEI